MPGWGGRPLDVQRLGGGLTNLNYRVDVGGGSFVVRICGHDTELLGINRLHEYECNLIAAEAGVAPAVVAFFPDLGSLVTQYVDGVRLPADQICTRTNIARVMRSVRALHSARPFPSAWSPLRAIEAYAHTAAHLGCPLPADSAELMSELSQVERLLYGSGAPRLVPCHNDLLNENFLDDGAIRIIDYEYSAMGDPFFDLANFSSHQRLTSEQDEWLLQAYTRNDDGPGAVSDEAARRLNLLKLVSDLREGMWGVVQIKLSKLDFDYESYAREWFGRYRAKRAILESACLVRLQSR